MPRFALHQASGTPHTPIRNRRRTGLISALALLAAPALAWATTAEPASAATDCTAPDGSHCLAIVNKSDSRILSWRLQVYDPDTHQFRDRGCLSVPGSSGAGRHLYPETHLAEGQRFTLDAYRDIRDCTGDMWAGQGWTVGGADSSNYTNATFTASDPDAP